jgi:hypothetical protein
MYRADCLDVARGGERDSIEARDRKRSAERSSWKGRLHNNALIATEYLTECLLLHESFDDSVGLRARMINVLDRQVELLFVPAPRAA